MEDNTKLKESIKLKIAISKLYREERNLAMKKKKFNLQKSILVASACLIFTTSIVFAENIQEFYNNFITKKIDILNPKSSTDYQFYDDMKQEKGIYYKKVTTYEEYLTYKNMWPDLLDMTKEEFDENFMIITAAENKETINLTLNDVYADDNNLYLIFGESNTNYDTSTVTGTKLNKELNRDNILIRDDLNIVITDSKYTKITDITTNYTKEQAIKEGCLVIKDNIIISDNKNAMNTFYENSQNGIEGFVRAYRIYGEEDIAIIDIGFYDNKYKINIVFFKDLTDISSDEYSYMKIYNTDEIGINGEKFITFNVNNDNGSEWYPILAYIKE